MAGRQLFHCPTDCGSLVLGKRHLDDGSVADLWHNCNDVSIVAAADGLDNSVKQVPPSVRSSPND